MLTKQFTNTQKQKNKTKIFLSEEYISFSYHNPEYEMTQ